MTRRTAFGKVQAALAVAVIVLSGWTIARAAQRGIDKMSVNQSAEASAGTRYSIERFDCLRALLQRHLREGTHIYVDHEAVGEARFQALIEIATPWAVVEADPADATVTIAFAPAPADRSCFGTSIAVGRPDRAARGSG